MGECVYNYMQVASKFKNPFRFSAEVFSARLVDCLPSDEDDGFDGKVGGLTLFLKDVGELRRILVGGCQSQRFANDIVGVRCFLAHLRVL